MKQKQIKPFNPKGSPLLEGLMLKLKLQYFDHLMQRADSLEKSLMLGKIEGRREWERMRCLDGITSAMDMNLGKLWDMVRDRESWHVAVHGFAKSRTRLCNWTTTKTWKLKKFYWQLVLANCEDADIIWFLAVDHRSLDDLNINRF